MLSVSKQPRPKHGQNIKNPGYSGKSKPIIKIKAVKVTKKGGKKAKKHTRSKRKSKKAGRQVLPADNNIGEASEVESDSDDSVDSVDRIPPMALTTSGLIIRGTAADVEELRNRLEDGTTDVNQEDDAGETLLFRAMMQSRVDIMRMLLDEFDADLNYIFNGSDLLEHSGAYEDNIRNSALVFLDDRARPMNRNWLTEQQRTRMMEQPHSFTYGRNVSGGSKKKRKTHKKSRKTKRRKTMKRRKRKAGSHSMIGRMTKPMKRAMGYYSKEPQHDYNNDPEISYDIQRYKNIQPPQPIIAKDT